MSSDIQKHMSLRQCILKTLYSFFREHPYGLAELRYLEEVCEADHQDINWNLVYLEKCGFVELDKSMECPPYISCTTSITAGGIDLVENRERFKEKFSGGINNENHGE